MQPKQQRARQGRKEPLLVFPQQSRNKQTMALCARGSGSEELSRVPGPGLRVALRGCQHRPLPACVASGPGVRSTARPQAQASGASPGPGCCLKGCLPG